MFALPDVIDGGGAKAVAQVKVAATIPAFKFFGVLGIFFDFDIDDDACVGVLNTASTGRGMGILKGIGNSG